MGRSCSRGSWDIPSQNSRLAASSGMPADPQPARGSPDRRPRGYRRCRGMRRRAHRGNSCTAAVCAWHAMTSHGTHAAAASARGRGLPWRPRGGITRGGVASGARPRSVRRTHGKPAPQLPRVPAPAGHGGHSAGRRTCFLLGFLALCG